MPSKLPPGRHHLTRAEVVADQRGRMIAGLGEAMSAKGFAGTTVADIIERAKVSKQTFYEHYDSKQACFMDAFARIHQMLDESSSAAKLGKTPMETLDSVLAKYLETIARNATMARLYLVEVYAAGPEALRTRMEMQQRTVEQFIFLFDLRTEAGKFACRAVVAAISALVTHELVNGGGPDGVRDLHAPLLVLSGQLMGTYSDLT
ncbi:hypothetical protein BH10ACT9_BH10ACT9_04710 [soil metagenome]